jgi:LysR substrate binding domain-containing protein
MATAEILDAVGEGAIDAGLVRCPPSRDGLEAHAVRHERQGVLLRGDDARAGAATIELSQLSDVALLLHPRDANPGHYYAILALCRAAGVEPRVLERSPALDLAQTPVVDGRAVAIVGESSRTVLPAALTWVALSPPATLEVALVARAHDRSPALERLLASAREAAVRLGWLDGDAAAL